MDRRAAGALLALAACIACSAAAPTASNHTALDLYEGASEGCYYNFQHYGEGDRIMTNEPCLNCTCHNRMLMCYLRVCPFTKPIGQDCTVEKRADQCCPIVTCPDVPVDLLTSTSTTSPAEYGATGLGKLDKYGCSINGKYFPEGSKVPPTPNKPCEHCYCIRNMTTCVMQECTLHVDGCTPIYHKDVCCPVRYSCDHPEDELPLLDDMSTTVRPTPGFLLTTTTVSPVTQMTQDCVHNDQIIADGASITTDKACEHCYCMKGDIVCVVQECGAPMENEGKNCTSLPPREGQCCPDTYICEGDEPSTEISIEATTDSILDKLTTLQPPRRGGVEGSGYRKEPSEAAYTDIPPVESVFEGSGEDQEPSKSIDEQEPIMPEKPNEFEKITPSLEEGDQYIPVTTKAPAAEEAKTTTKGEDKDVTLDEDLIKETTESEIYLPTTQRPLEKEVDETTSKVTESDDLAQEHPHHPTVISTTITEKPDQFTTESGESLNTVSDIVLDKEHDKHEDEVTPSTPIQDEKKTSEVDESTEHKTTKSENDQDVTLTPILEHTSKLEYPTASQEILDEIEKGTTERMDAVTEQIADKETAKLDNDISGTTSTPTVEEIQTITPEGPEKDTSDEKEMSKPDQYIPSTTSMPLEEFDKLTTEPNHAQNTVDVADEESSYPHSSGLDESQKTTAFDLGYTVTEEVIKEDDAHKPGEHIPDILPTSEESKPTVEPDKGLNTIPSEIDEESSSQPSLVDKTTSSVEIKASELPVTVDAVEPHGVDTESPTSQESSSTIPDFHVTKVDQYTITTEPSFRKEDEISVSTEKPKEESPSTTIKAEFVDEGLIPTSSHDETLSTGADISSMDEDMTTTAPEYHKESDDTVEAKPPTTPSVLETSSGSVSSPEIVVVTTHEPEDDVTPSTEKAADVTAIPSVGPYEEPSRIPGEGDCLLNSVTYKNNTVVPSTNNCHTGCKCISSIIKCDPIICSPPPDYMDNCQSIYDTPDSCCPTYICDHPRETIPPQSDNQMSGTEPPMPPPTIECRGDQCELSEPMKPTELTADDKITSQCGPGGCDDVAKEPVFSHPSVEHSECPDGKCELPTHSQMPPTVPCAGDDCKVTDEEIPVPQLCENEENCKKTDIPITQTDTNTECGSNGCDSDINLLPHDSHQAPCKEDGCKVEEIIPSECTGDEPCRRKDSLGAEKLPTKCEGSDCVQKTDTTITEDVHDISTELSIQQQPATEQSPEKIVPAEKDKPEQEAVPVTELVTEPESVPVEYYPTTDVSAEKISEVQEMITEEPNLFETTTEPISIEETSSKKSDTVQDEHDDKPMLTEEQKHEEHTPGLPSDEKEKGEETPVDADKEHTDKLAPIEDEGIKIPDVTEEYPVQSTEAAVPIKESTDEPALDEVSGTKVPDTTQEFIDKSTKMPDVEKEQTEKPTIVPDLDTKVPDTSEDHTTGPTFNTDQEPKIPDVEETGYTDKPLSAEEQQTKMPISADIEHTDKLTPGEDEVTKTPNVIDEDSDKLTESEVTKTDKPTIDESGTKVPDFIEEHTSETLIKDEGTETPGAVIEGHTDKPPSVEEQETKTPDAATGDTTDKMHEVEKEVTEVPEFTDKNKPTETPDLHTDEPVPITESGTHLPDIVKENTDEPTGLQEEVTKSPYDGEEHSEKLPSLEEQQEKLPDSVDKEHMDKLTPVEEDGTKVPDITEIYIEEPTKMPELIKEHTDESTLVKDSETKIPEPIEEHTDEPVEEGTTIPTTIEQQQAVIPDNVTDKTVIPDSVTDKTVIHDSVTDKTVIPDNDNEKTILPEDEHTTKPTVIKEEDEEKLGIIESESTTEPSTEQEESTESLEPIKDNITKKPIIIDDGILDEIEGSTDTEMKEETSTKDKPSVIKHEDVEGPTTVEKDHTSAPIDVEHTDKPEILEIITETSEPAKDEHVSHSQDEEGSGTEGPEMYVTESEVKLPEVSQTPSYESQTTINEDSTRTESNLIPVDVTIPDVTSSQATLTSESSDVKGPQSTITSDQESDTISPTEKVTLVDMELEKTTKEPSEATIVQEALPSLPEEEKETMQPFEPPVPSKEPPTSEKEATERPELVITTEPVEKTTLLTDQETITEQGDIYTEIPEQDSSTAKSPDEVIIEPQEGTQPELSDLTTIGPVNEESFTKVFEKEYPKPADSESHVTDTVVESGSTPALPEPEIIKATEVPVIVDVETQKTELPIKQDSEPEKLPTLTPTDLIHEEKTHKPEIFTPEKEEMITSTKATIITAPTETDFTKVEDSYVTDDENTSTEYSKETTERFEPYVTDKVYTSTEKSYKPTKGPEDIKTPEVIVVPIQTETNPAESDVTEKLERATELPAIESTTSITPELSQETGSEPSMPSEEPHRKTDTAESNQNEPDTSVFATTELTVPIITESQEKTSLSIDDTTRQEEKATQTPDFIHSDAFTVPQEIYATKAPASAEIPEAHVTISSRPEESKVTESPYSEPHITESHETGIKSEEPALTDVEKTTRSPATSAIPEDTKPEGHDIPLPEVQKPSTDYPESILEMQTKVPQTQVTTEASLSLVTEYQPDIDITTEGHKKPSEDEIQTEIQEQTTEKVKDATSLVEVTTSKEIEDITKSSDQTTAQADISSTSPDLIELEVHTHKPVDGISTESPADEKDHTYESGDVTSTPLPPSKEEGTTTQDIITEDEHLVTVSPTAEDNTQKVPEGTHVVSLPEGESTTAHPQEVIESSETPGKIKPEEDIEAATKPNEIPSEETSTIAVVVSETQTTSAVPEEASESVSESYTSAKPAHEETTIADQKYITTSKPAQDMEVTPEVIQTELPVSGLDIEVPTEKETYATAKPTQPHIHDASDKTTVPEDDLIYTTTKATTVKQEELLTPSSEDKYSKPEDKPTSEVLPPSSTAEIPKPAADIEPTEEIPAPEDDGHFPPSGTGYGEPDYTEEDQAFGPGTCRYGGKVYVSAQQIPRDDPCDFCFCFRSDIICLQQSCPPPIHGCHEEPIQGFCCPRYECPVSMATTVNVTTTTTTTTTTLPPHFPTHSYKGAAHRRGCQIKGHTYKVGEVVRSSSGPCLHCKCGGDGQMKCDPKACTPEPMLRQMIAAAVSAKRRR